MKNITNKINKETDNKKKLNLDRTEKIFLKSINHLDKREQETLLKLYSEIIKDL